MALADPEPNPEPKPRSHLATNPRRREKTQILDLQARLYELATDAETEAKDVAACARAWDVLADRVRILKGKPLPGQRRPVPDALLKPKPKPPTAVPVEE